LRFNFGGITVLTPAFSGWMFASSPQSSAMQHPVYDVWVKECRVTPKTNAMDATQPNTALKNLK